MGIRFAKERKLPRKTKFRKQTRDIYCNENMCMAFLLYMFSCEQLNWLTEQTTSYSDHIEIIFNFSPVCILL